MSLMEMFANPELIDQLTFGQKMLASFFTMLIGLGITFLVLILIWIFIVLMGKALHTDNKAKENKKASKNGQAGKSQATSKGLAAGSEGEIAAVIAAATAAYNKEKEEIAAVIAATIATYESDSLATNGLVVKRITRPRVSDALWVSSGIETRLEVKAERPRRKMIRKEQ